MKQKIIFPMVLVIVLGMIGVSRKHYVLPATEHPFIAPARTAPKNIDGILEPPTAMCKKSTPADAAEPTYPIDEFDTDIPISPIGRFILLQ